RRCAGKTGARETAIGNLRSAADLHLAGLDIAPAALEELLSVDTDAWRTEAAELGKDLDTYGSRTPDALRAELAALRQRLG
ncbi:MAG: phosphoenolpyruvate carboxykinase domain-containing protein, partial [Gammaproteobacteria bacterium]